MPLGRTITLAALAFAAAGAAGPATARGIGAAPPAGQLPATAPGGTLGLAGPRNVADAIRGGHAYGVRPGLDRGAERGPGGWARPPGR